MKFLPLLYPFPTGSTTPKTIALPANIDQTLAHTVVNMDTSVESARPHTFTVPTVDIARYERRPNARTLATTLGKEEVHRRNSEIPSPHMVPDMLPEPTSPS